MITTFCCGLSGGMLAVLGTGRPEEISWKFLRLLGLFVVALATVAAAFTIRSETGSDSGIHEGIVLLEGGVVLTAVIVVLLAPWASRWALWFRVLCLAGGAGGLVAACLRGLYEGGLGKGITVADSPMAATLTVVSVTLGAILLGSITVAWLLGHAYLTATKMTIGPLRHFSRVLSWAVILRVGFAVFSVGWAFLAEGNESDTILSELANQWIVVSLRVGVGLIAVGLFAYMVSDCVRLRATQSATGILYFGSVFAYVGELASQYLTSQCGWPL